MFRLLPVLFVLSGCAHLPTPSGACPSDFPIKGNMDSYIYHLPDSKYYWNTNAEWCFKSEEDAKNMGYRPIKPQEER
jgi:large subunit ribosomal protein L17